MERDRVGSIMIDSKTEAFKLLVKRLSHYRVRVKILCVNWWRNIV